ncbi:MAG: 4-alpha-glucanotransferase [Gallionella sp.]|nr:4-alpha-glucanotransferase [Gallionella sp.]MDD4946486.1 4-alpha-glucanotransferase [Gallionella sp.]
MIDERTSGILLHPTSLPGSFGVGDLGANAFLFVDWLIGAGQTYWQVLPMGETGPGNSPYMSSSAFAGSVLMIDLHELAHQGWLTDEDLIPHPEFRHDRVDYGLANQFRLERLRRAAKHFFSNANESVLSDYSEFCMAEREWLKDYALFKTILEQQQGRSWNTWPQPLANREIEALRKLEVESVEQINFWKFTQWCYYRQWKRLKQYANEHGIRLIGDVPIFVAYQSADVWAHPELFELDEMGAPTVVAGVPPDYFSATGQLWGNPLYRWEEHEETHFSWWVRRLHHALRNYDRVRVDHFRGFAGYWEVPASETTAMNGCWMPGPGDKLFLAFKKAFVELPIIAEDLGVITPDVAELRDKFELPGMRILQFAFAEDNSNHFLPHNYIANTIAYTGTHDNDTMLGWWNHASEHEINFVKQYLGREVIDVPWDMMAALSGSVANTVIFPMQDVLCLSSEYRMNLPGSAEHNWEWRFSWDQVQPWQTIKLSKMTRMNDRSQSCPAGC